MEIKMLTLSPKGMIEIAKHEGICLRRYLDAVEVWTWGLGHTSMAGEPDPRSITRDTSIEEVVRVFKIDMKKYEDMVRRQTKHLEPLSQHEHDALTSFVYNLGEGNLRTLVKGRNRGQIAAAIPRYNRAGGRELPGLTTRRNAEKAMFMYGRYPGGKVPVFPVNANERPVYSKAKLIDLAPYL